MRVTVSPCHSLPQRTIYRQRGRDSSNVSVCRLKHPTQQSVHERMKGIMKRLRLLIPFRLRLEVSTAIIVTVAILVVGRSYSGISCYDSKIRSSSGTTISSSSSSVSSSCASGTAGTAGRATTRTSTLSSQPTTTLAAVTFVSAMVFRTPTSCSSRTTHDDSNHATFLLRYVFSKEPSSPSNRIQSVSWTSLSMTSSSSSSHQRDHHYHHRQHHHQRSHHRHSFRPSYGSSSSAVSSSLSLSRSDGQQWLDQDGIFPSRSYSDRIGVGREASGLGDSVGGGILLTPDDPRLDQTYAEFPLHSWDTLMDTALLHVDGQQMGCRFVDVGSGMGRISVYATLSRPQWAVHGIEISSILHDEAVEVAEKAVQDNLLVKNNDGDYTTTESSSSSSPSYSDLSFHLGSALQFTDDAHDDGNTTSSSSSNTIRSVLSSVDLMFLYSTAFPAKNFDPDIGALVLDPQWSYSLSQSCRNGIVAVTTDRALDPFYGWELIEKIDVDNPEVFGSSGYISILRK